jgi:hypothetical protein
MGNMNPTITASALSPPQTLHRSSETHANILERCGCIVAFRKNTWEWCRPLLQLCWGCGAQTALHHVGIMWEAALAKKPQIRAKLPHANLY